jgi:predicted nucleic acid-binding protein
VSYLLDTCVISEFAKPDPEPKVLQWLDEQAEDTLFTSTIVLEELARGVSRLPEGSRRRRLNAWLYSDLVERFSRRLLMVSAEVALKWGETSGAAMRAGVQISMADGLIGATGIVHSLVVVTRNVDDLSPTGAVVFNPWTDHGD